LRASRSRRSRHGAVFSGRARSTGRACGTSGSGRTDYNVVGYFRIVNINIITVDVSSTATNISDTTNQINRDFSSYRILYNFQTSKLTTSSVVVQAKPSTIYLVCTGTGLEQDNPTPLGQRGHNNRVASCYEQILWYKQVTLGMVKDHRATHGRLTIHGYRDLWQSSEDNTSSEDKPCARKGIHLVLLICNVTQKV
jgi:hypothetical protein